MLFKIMFGYCPEIEGTETVETKIYFFKKKQKQRHKNKNKSFMRNFGMNFCIFKIRDIDVTISRDNIYYFCS
jgi:hypothetical protein